MQLRPLAGSPRGSTPLCARACGERERRRRRKKSAPVAVARARSLSACVMCVGARRRCCVEGGREREATEALVVKKEEALAVRESNFIEGAAAPTIGGAATAAGKGGAAPLPLKPRPCPPPLNINQPQALSGRPPTFINPAPSSAEARTPTQAPRTPRARCRRSGWARRRAPGCRPGCCRTRRAALES